MKQQQAAQAQLRIASVPEVVSLAYNQYLRNLKRGKSSRRITVFLSPHVLPPKLPPDGLVKTAFGEVRMKSIFQPVQGRWIVNVIFPEEGFRLSDFINDPSQ
jgi:hypothetical protein